MKKIFYTSKSRLLLLTLFALITGVSPAWAQTTEEFSGDTWPDGWSLGGSATATDFYLETDNDLYNTPTPKRGVYGQVSSGTTKYIITPVVNGNGSFQFKRRNSSNGSVYVYTIADDGTLSATAITSNSSKPTSWTSVSFSNVENKKLAIVLNGRMDKFIYTPGTDVSAGIGVYSDSEATTAVKNGVNLNWGLVETAQSQTYYIKNESGADWNNLAVSHSGNATVSSVSSSLADDAVIALNIGMAASGSTNDEITITAGEDLTFTISISGSVKDAEKIFIDFEDNAMPESWSFDSGWTATSGYANIGYTGAYIRSGYISVDEGGEDLLFDYQGNYSWGGSYSDIKVYWARTGNGSDADWTEVSATYSITYNEWKTASVRIPANARYIAIYGKYVNIDNIYGLKVNNAEPEAIGVMSFSQSDYAFGLVSENVTSSAFTISNNGTGAVNGLSVVSNSDYFEVAVADNATSIAAGETATFTVTIKPGSAVGKLSGTITVSATDQESVSFGVSGYVLPAGTTSENFDDQAVPTNWSSTGTWKTGNESEIGATSAATMTTPNVTVKDGDFLAIKVRNYGSYSDDYVQVEGYDGSSWSVIKKIMSTEFYSSSSSTTLIVDVPTTAKQLRFTAYYAYIDEIAGLRYAPVLTVKQGDATVTTPAAYAFGEIGATQKVTYSLANTGAGAGTINITNVVSSNDVFTTNWTESTAAPFDLVITANYNAEKAGEQNGAITVTTTEGEFVINLTSTFLAANAPKFAVVMNETEQTTGAAFAYGIITAETTKSFTIKNDGTGALNVTAITLPDDDFTTDLATAPSVETPLVIAAGTSQTINVKLAANTKAIKSGNIVISATNFDDFTLAATATVMPGAENVTFTSVPNGWDKGNWTLDTTNGDLYTASSSKPYLTTSKLSFSANDFIVVNAKKYDNDNGDYIQVQYSTDNGESWTDLQKLDDSTLPTRDAGYSDIVVSGIPETANKLRFQGYYARIKQIAGLTYDANDPKLAVYSDAEATTEVATATAKDFGWKNTTATETYYIKNAGTGTLTISNISEVEGFTAATAGGATTVAAGADPLALTITMTADAVGAKSGTFTITTDGGVFTIPVSGFVYGDKNLIDFTVEGAKAPAGWTMGNWSISNNQMASGNSSTSMTTTNFTAAKGEKLYVEAISTSTSYYNTPALTYAIGDGTPVSIADGLTSSASKVIEIDALSDIDSDEATVKLTFTGQYVAIRRIYGFTAVTEPIMTTTAADIAFGMQTAESDEQTFTISNEGSATLEGLSVTLAKTDDDAEYSVALYDGDAAFTSTDLEAGKTITVKVKQLFDINKLGAKNDVLTIAATGQTPVTINLSGATRDGSKQYIDFAEGIPAGWTNSSWSVSSGYARTNNGTLRMAPLTVAANEKLSLDARLTTSTSGSLKARYTTNYGVDWTEIDIPAVYNYTDFTNYEIDLGNTDAVTAFIEFVGVYAAIDNVYGGVATTAPLLEVTEGTTAIANNTNVDFGSNLQAEPTAKVYTLTNKGNASLTVAVAKTGDVTVTPAETTIAAGATADITVSLPYDQENVGDKEGSVTITTGTAVFTLNFAGSTIDPTALNEELASLPAGWYNNGWTVDGSAHIFSGVEKEIITEQYGAEAGKNVLSFKVKAQSGTEGTLKVYTSADRKTWSEPTEITLTNEYETKSLEALADGNYYVKFVSLNADIDDLVGLKKIAGIEHDLYVSTSNIPAETIVPETSITATATVNSLRAAETGVTAKLFFGDYEVATADAQDIALNGSKTFTLVGNVPAEEGTYAAKIVVYYSDNSVAFETLTTDVKVEHTRTLAIQTFARDGEGTMDADANNQISPAFKVTVKNTGTTALTPIIKVKQGETVVGTATGTELAADATSEEITVNATNMSAGEGGDLSFTAEAYWSTEADAEAFAYAEPVTITVNAAAPKFNLAVKDGAAVADGDAVAFGLVKEATTKTYTITNSGNAALELESIVATDGFEATALTTDNKTIAADGTLDIDVTLKDEQGKKDGTLVFTYKVDATNNATFTLNLSGRSVSADTWTVAFNDYSASIPADWTNNGWSVAGEYNDYHGAAYTNTATATLMTPRLHATNGEELTFDVVNNYYNTATYAYSTNKITWSEEVTISGTGEKSFIAPAEGDYYIRFTGRGAYLQNFVGFKLNPLEHDMEIASSSVPATGMQYGNYVATVTLKENAGKDEAITAKLYVDGTAIDANINVDKTQADKNAQTVVTLTWEPQTAITEAVEAYVEVEYAGGTLKTDAVSLTIDKVFTLSEEVAPTFASTSTTYPAIKLERSFAAGWNTVCLPFAIDNVEDFFGTGAKAYNFTGYSDGVLSFSYVTTLNASYPYIVYVPAAIDEKIVKNVEIGFAYTTPSTTATYFTGTYEPIADMTGKYGITPAAKIAKGKEGSKMKGFRAYFDLGSIAAPVLTLSFDDMATGIDTVMMDFAGDDKAFDLSGRRVQSLKKGSVYIINGKAVVIK